MLSNFVREYNINRVFLSFSGLWPFQDRLVKNVLRTFCVLLEISSYAPEILLLCDHWDNSQMIFDAGYQFIFTTSFVGRGLHNIWNQDRLQQLCIAIDNHWDIFTDDLEVQVMKNYSSLSRKFTKLFAGLLIVMLLTFVAIPLAPVLLDVIMPINESRPRIFAVEVEFRLNKEDYFIFIFGYTTAIILVGINIVMGVDAMHIMCTAHACSLFAAVR
ncbi:hypothetical protein PUN28_011485 [Cardiocondyla obscurior]|uniref:Odorant receptor n=1 Tax=Cardiocondyla obscurior TaxID=286306 RepID=A0AAW2FG42_9HYME